MPCPGPTNDLLFGALTPLLFLPRGNRLISAGGLTFAWGLQQSPTERRLCCKEAWELYANVPDPVVGQG